VKGYGWGSFCHELSFYVILSQVIANCWKNVKQPSHSNVNQDHIILSFSPTLSWSSYHLIFLFESIAPKMSWRKDLSWLFKSKFLFEKFSSFCGLYPVLYLYSMVFKPLNLHVYHWKRLKLSKANFRCLGKIGLSNFRGFKPPEQNLPLHHFSYFSLSLSLKNNCEGDPKTPIGDSMILSWNLGVLGWNQLPKNRCLRFPNRFFSISRYFHLILNLFAP
jgi:hypothetical protein